MILAFPTKQTCFRCEHYLDQYCRLFDEPIESEIEAAKDCNGFEVADDA
jgi:hypothetical protein